MALVKQEFDDDKKPGTKPTSTHTGSTRIPVSTNTDESNLAGTNNIQNSRGTPKQTQPSVPVNNTETNIAGTNNASSSFGTPQQNTSRNRDIYGNDYTRPSSSNIDSLKDNYVAKSNLENIQPELSKMADSSNRKAQEVIGTIGNTINGITSYFERIGQEYTDREEAIDRIRKDRYWESKEKSYQQEDENRNRLVQELMGDDPNKYYNLDGTPIDFEGQIRALNGQKVTLEDFISNGGKNPYTQAELDNITAKIDELNQLNERRTAYEEAVNLEALKNSGDEEAYRRYRETISHKNDNLFQRLGSATSHLITQTFNSIPSAIDQLFYRVDSAIAKQGLDALNLAHDNNEIDTDTYVETLAEIDNSVKQAQERYNDSTSLKTREIVDQYGANTYYGANDVERFILQAGESTAQFMMHYAIGVGMASAFSSASSIGAIRELGGNIATLTMSGLSATEKTNQLLQEGYDIDTAFRNGLFTGLVSYATEKVGMDRFVEMLGTPVSANIMGQILVRNTKSAISEGLEEVVEGIMDPLIDSVTLGKDYEVNGTELFTSFLLGGTSGLLMATGATVGAIANSPIGKIIVANRQQRQMLINEINVLRESLPTMTAEQRAVALEEIRKGESAVNEYDSKSITLGVSFSSDFVEPISSTEADRAVIEALTPDVNNEIQNLSALNEIQNRINTDIDSVVNAENDITTITQEILNNNGYNIDAQVFNSLDTQRQNDALVALDFAKLMGMDVNVTDESGIRNALEQFGFNGDENKLQRIIEGTNGLVAPDGSIIINGSKRPILSTLAHELTHGTESSQFYSQLKDLVQRSFGNEWEKALQQKIEDYKDIENFDAEKEVVARFLEDKLGDEQFIDDLVKYNYSLGSKIWQDLNAIGNTDEVVRLRNAFEKAFADNYEQNGSKLSFTYDKNNSVVIDKGSFNNEIQKYKINTNQNINHQIRDLMMAKYRDIIVDIGGLYDGYIKRGGIEEFSYPANRRYSDEIKNVRSEVSSELKELLKNAVYLKTEPNTDGDGDYDYFNLLFGIKDGDKTKYYDGLVNIKVSPKGTPTFYDIRVKENRSTSGNKSTSPVSNINFSYNPQNVNNSLTSLENFLRSDEIIDKLGLLDGYTGFNSNVGNLEYDSQRPAQTREEVLQNNIEGMIDTIDNAFQEYLQDNDITPEQVDINDLRDYLSDPYLAEGTDLETLRTTGELDELASLATDYLADKYNLNKELDTLRPDGSRKDLRAIHNLSEDELLKSLNLGGFAMPSIAVTKDSISHSGYGDISVVFDKNTIDPSVRENEVFGGDAYTSRFPALEYKVSATDEMFRLYDIEKKYGLRSLGVKYDSGNLEDLFNSSANLEDAKKRLSNMDATKILFLDSRNMLDKVINKELPQVAIESGLVNSLVKVMSEEYNAFVDDLAGRMVEDSGLRNNKDIYTPSGNRRSFEQLHDEYNLENALKLMLDASRGNSRNVETGFGSTGINGMIASQTQRFKNIDDIIKNEDRLNDLANNEYAEIRQQLSESINNEIYKFVTETGISDGLGVYETYQVGDALAMEMLNAKSDKQALKIASEYYTGKATDEQILDFYHAIQEYKEPLRNMPTRYFEAKPRRIVNPSEWKQVYAPDTTNPELLQRLRDMGVEVIEYSKDNDNGRQEAMNQNVQRFQFSLGKQDTQESVQDDSDRSQYFDYGMNPVRNVDILKQTKAGPTSRFWNNLANSQYVSDEEAERIQKMVRDGLGAYEKTSRKIQNREAKNMLRQMGMENTFKYVMNADSIDTMAVDNALARTLLSEMNQKGLAGTENYHQLEARLQWRATMQGQALEAWKGFRDSTPEGQVVTIRSEIERIQQGLSERYGDGAYDIQLNEELIDDYLRARTQEERDLIREQLARDVAKQIPPSAVEQLNSFRHLSMLFNPRTWVKNSLANKAMGYVNEGTRAVRSVLESIAYERGKNNENSVFNGMERQAGTYNPFNKSDVEQFKQFKEQYNTEFKNKIDMKYSAIDAGNVLLGTGFGEEVSRYRDAFTSKFLNKLSEINAKMMSDAPGMSTAYAKSMVGYLKANNLDYKTMTPEQIKKAQEFAINEAKYATFNSYNKLASDIAQFSRDGSVARRVVIESFLPFKRTPLNLLKTGFRYTPVGLAETMTNGFVQLKQGKLTANEWINNVAQGMTGSAIMALGALLSHMGIFRTKDDDKARKQYFDQDLGEQEYSLNWDGKSYTIDWLDPMIVPLAMGAELMKYVENGEYSLNELTNLVAGLADPMFETSMLSGIQKNLSNYSQGTTQWWGRIAQNAVTNYVQQYIPSIFGATARTIDDTRRSTYTDKGAFDRAYRQTLNKIPGLSMLNEPYVNRKGEEQKNQGNNIIDRAILNFLSPGYYANKEITKYDKEMYRLYEQTGNIDSLPSSDSKSLTFEGETYKFTPKQYTQWQKTRWSTETEYVNQFMDSKVYQNLTDEERVETIKDIRSYAQKVAKQHFLADQGIEYDDKQLSDARGAIVNGIELYAYYDYLNNAGSTQSKKIEYLEKTDLSQKQKEYLWGLNDYKKSYQDAYNKVFGKESTPKETTPTPAPEEEREEFYA